MAVILVTSLFALIMFWVSWRYLRRRDPLLRDVMWMFASVAMLFVLGVIGLFVGRPPDWVLMFAVGLLLAKPLFTLRLVSRLRPVRWWWWPVASAAWALSSLPVLASSPRPAPRPEVWAAVAVFFVLEGVSAGLLGAEARRRGGAARARLWCAAAGTGLFGAALLVSAVGRAVESRVLAVVSGVLYLVAFLPPGRLRRAWSQRATHAVMGRLLSVPAHETAEIWHGYCHGVIAVLGADAVVVLIPAADQTVQVAGHAGPPLDAVDCPADGLAELLAAGDTIDALAGWTHPPAIAVAFAQASDTRFVTVAPVPAPAGQGALLLLDRYRTLFAEDDVAACTELAGHAAALAGRAQTLAERESLALIVDSSHDAIIGRTLDGTITSWNTGAQLLYGYQRDEVIGRPASLLVPAGKPDDEVELMLSGGHAEQHQVQRRRKDGTVITVSLTLSPITDANGEVTGLASISRDIGERQRAEAMFEGLLQAAPDAIVGVTHDGTITLINAQAERLFGYPREELLSQSVDILVPERLRAGHVGRRDGYFAHPRNRPMGAGAALTAVRKDGTEFPAEISLSSVNTDQGMIVTTAIRDVTDRLIAQTERERLIAQAERAASERRLQHARRLESLGELAGGVAHDFNNILAVISNYTAMVRETLESPVPDPAELAQARNDLVQVSRAAERAARLTKQLLAFGRRDITQATVLSLNHVIGDVEQMLRRSIGEHIHLVTSLEQQLWPVHADAGQLEQILVNLAVNARDAMPGGGTLSIDTSNADLAGEDVIGTALKPGRYVRVRVSDTGSGMPPQVVERAFEPFYTTKPKGSGTGLGLATVYGIATAAGGDVRLYSEADIGTTVTVILPAVDDEATTTTEPAADRGPGGEPDAGPPPDETILMVEDEDDLRQITGRILTRAGYHVLTAAGGAQAIHLAQTHPGPVHLLLTDVIMPKMMGNEVAVQVKRHRPDIPVLYMSGYAGPALTENGTLPDGVTIIEKPFTSHELLDGVRAHLHPAAGAGEPAAESQPAPPKQHSRTR